MNFTTRHRDTLLKALDEKVSGINRSKSKQPRFATFYDQDIAEIREVQAIIRSWATQELAEPEAKNRK